MRVSYVGMISQDVSIKPGVIKVVLKSDAKALDEDCTVKNITRINLRFKVDNSLRLANDSTATTRGGDNNMMFELYTEKKSAAGGNGGDGSDDGGKGDGGEPGGGSGGGEAPDPAA